MAEESSSWPTPVWFESGGPISDTSDIGSAESFRPLRAHKPRHEGNRDRRRLRSSVGEQRINATVCRCGDPILAGATRHCDPCGVGHDARGLQLLRACTTHNATDDPRWKEDHRRQCADDGSTPASTRMWRQKKARALGATPSCLELAIGGSPRRNQRLDFDDHQRLAPVHRHVEEDTPSSRPRWSVDWR